MTGFASARSRLDRATLNTFGGPVLLLCDGTAVREITGFISTINALPIQPLDGVEHFRSYELTCDRADVAGVEPDWTVKAEGVEYPVLEVPDGPPGLVNVLLGDPL